MSRLITVFDAQLPVYGAAADILDGAFMKPGTTAANDFGALIPATGSGAGPYILGKINGGLDYSVDAETLVAGTSFVTKKIELIQPTRVWRVEYDLASLITCTEAVSTTTITVTSLENDIDTSFIYVVQGLGVGQTNYLTASAAGSATLKAAFATSLDTTSKFIKILRRFHRVYGLNADGTKLSSQAGAGTALGMVFDSFVKLGNEEVQLNPTKHAALTSLNTRRGLKFFADIVFLKTAFYAVD